jgi:hypothetical protein
VRIDALLNHVRPALEARGEWDTVLELLTDLRNRGTSATRQRRAASLRETVLALAAETRGE